MPRTITPLEDLVNITEFEAMAQRSLNGELFGLIADQPRGAFDRITLRPRMMVDTRKLDLSLDLFGQQLFAPILVAPMQGQSRFHPEGEAGTAKGAAAAKTAMVIADTPGLALDPVVKAANGGVWFQIDSKDGVDAVRARAGNAVSAGCKAICLTASGWDWSAVDSFRKGLKAPVLLKGIMSADEARTAVTHGIQGIVVSSYTGSPAVGLAQSIEVLPGIATAVAGKIPILIDGGFRRGNDFLAAVALGATAVMVGRPVLWGLSAYGPPGVQRAIEMMQTGLARDMAMCGKVNLKALDRSVVKIHRA